MVLSLLVHVVLYPFLMTIASVRWPLGSGVLEKQSSFFFFLDLACL